MEEEDGEFGEGLAVEGEDNGEEEEGALYMEDDSDPYTDIREISVTERMDFSKTATSPRTCMTSCVNFPGSSKGGSKKAKRSYACARTWADLLVRIGQLRQVHGVFGRDTKRTKPHQKNRVLFHRVANCSKICLDRSGCVLWIDNTNFFTSSLKLQRNREISFFLP